MRLVPILTAAALVAMSLDARAQDSIDCGAINSTVESNVCAERELEAADAKLNEVYKKVLDKIAERDLDKPFDKTSWGEAMRASQRAWIAFRDADCKGAVPMEWSGGTGTTAAVLTCMTDKTEKRTKELAERFGIEELNDRME